MARVTMFGRLADAAGWRTRIVAADTLSALTAELSREDAGLGAALEGGSVSTIVNDVLVRGDAAVGADDEVAFLPPMSGG